MSRALPETARRALVQGVNARPRRTKLILAMGAALVAVAYLTWLWSQERLALSPTQLVIRTGSHQWEYAVSPKLCLQWIAAIGLLAGFTRPWRVSKTARAGVWRFAASAWLVSAILVVLVLMQWLRVERLDVFYVAVTCVTATLIVYLLVRGRALGLPVSGLRWAFCRGRGWTLPLVLAIGAVVVGVVGWRVVLGGHPIITDSQSQIAQAHLMLEGQWRLDISQALRDVIEFPYAVPGVSSYSQYPPGHILAMLPFLAVGLPAQALNLLAAVVILLLTLRLARDVAGRTAGPVAGVLILGSPLFLVLSGSGMNHVTTCLALTAMAVCFMPLAGRGAGVREVRWRCLLGGLALGWAMTNRPVTACAHALVWCVVWLCDWPGWHAPTPTSYPRPSRPTRRDQIRRLAWTVLGLMPFALIFMVYNLKTTGHPLVMGYQISNPELHRLGFSREGPIPYTPLDALDNLAANVFSLNVVLFGWACGSWTILLVWFARARLRRGEVILAALILTQTLVYALYAFHDLLIGPRFLFELMPAFAVLGAAGLSPLLRRGDRRAACAWIAILLLACGAIGAGKGLWEDKLGSIVRRHEGLDQFMRKHLPAERPTVVVLPWPYHEMIGRYFRSPRSRPPLWFVLRDNEPKARALPELVDYEWIPYRPGSGSSESSP